MQNLYYSCISQSTSEVTKKLLTLERVENRLEYSESNYNLILLERDGVEAI